ncbi:cytochrome c1 [Wenzhouxiangella marina]|uniref:Ubiquinol cytochrome C oxidoreductase, cytochrome C1 subunit n=1 Tax=Wenzhouxiangella marina TaxID=1579979 RepID=A0A0K0XVL4_9GAMM|nr:cytochrome c1 [Wenzhouxiangella marina]AKS41677.1 Ubiquinol cytochrome C oxidoreductase, cytochrome C1 subunit [Wenzhouxiangella marina]MBB6086562.1 ubiquinol-cytochrome c reductase cytochrome c1 subunit [Wenzhouxiangella marina]
MKLSKSFVGLLAGMLGLTAQAAGGGDYDHANVNVHDIASLQRGAAMFVNYCMGCHSAQYMRYQRLSEDLELSEEEIEQFLILGDQEIGDYMKTSMPYEQATAWFGKAPPDLTLTARSRGEDWIYTFLRSYYLSDEGWNNTVLANAAMPNVLWELQGVQRPITETVVDEAGTPHTQVVSLELDQPGMMSEEEFDAAVRDLVAFMSYMAEPAVLKRERMGAWVLLFLSLFTFLSYLLYQEYWKDVKK